MTVREPVQEGFIDDGRNVLVPFDTREAIPLKQAAAIAGKSEGTVTRWCLGHAIGRRVGGGAWQVSRVALAMLLDGNRAALAAYHRGDRGSPLVAPYFAHCGLADMIERAALLNGE